MTRWDATLINEEVRLCKQVVGTRSQLLCRVHGKIDVNVLMRIIYRDANFHILLAQDRLLDIVPLRVPRALHAFKQLLKV